MKFFPQQRSPILKMWARLQWCPNSRTSAGHLSARATPINKTKGKVSVFTPDFRFPVYKRNIVYNLQSNSIPKYARTRTWTRYKPRRYSSTAARATMADLATVSKGNFELSWNSRYVTYQQLLWFVFFLTRNSLCLQHSANRIVDWRLFYLLRISVRNNKAISLRSSIPESINFVTALVSSLIACLQSSPEVMDGITSRTKK